MNVIIVDDEQMALEDLRDSVADVYPDAEINCFTYYTDAYEFVKNNPCDIALLDIQMPGKTGLEMAKDIKDINNDVNIVFVTGYSEYAVEAFSINASGYILKPARKSDIVNAFENLRNPVSRDGSRLFVQCFGNFELFCKGKPVRFGRSKSKEIFAYLVNLNGASTNTNELCAVLWEDTADSDSGKHYLRNLISDLKSTLKKCGAEDAFIHKRNYFAVDKSKFDCDFYMYLNYDTAAVNAYKGEYMSQYSWAELTHAFLEKNRDEYMVKGKLAEK